MPRTHGDLDGNVPDKADAVLILIDCINDLEFPEGEQLLEWAVPMAHALAQLRRRAKQAGIPVVYVNDNFGRWRSDFKTHVQHCLESGVRGEPICKLLKPDEDDYFVLKPRHSGFFSTTLELLLDHFQAETLILTGVASNICVLFTANDAYLRGYRLLVPSDCVAANRQDDNDTALAQMRAILKADTRPSGELDLNSFHVSATDEHE